MLYITETPTVPTWSLTWTQYCTYLVDCMLSCYCHSCHCRYCSNWCCSHCDWHMHLANFLAATAGLEAPPCRQGQVCNKECQKDINQKPLFYKPLMKEHGCMWFRARTHLPPVFHWCKCISLVGIYITQKEQKYHSPASTACRLSSLICYCREKPKKNIKPWWAVKTRKCHRQRETMKELLSHV